MHVGVAGGKARRELVAEQRELRGRQVGEDRHAVLLEGRHDLAHAADAGLRVHGGAVQKLRERRKRLDALRVREERELTVIRPTLQALIALPALRRARDDDAIADLDALHLGADRLDDAEAAVVRHLGPLDRVGAERAAHDRVARRHGHGADDHLPRDRSAAAACSWTSRVFEWRTRPLNVRPVCVPVSTAGACAPIPGAPVRIAPPPPSAVAPDFNTSLRVKRRRRLDRVSMSCSLAMRPFIMS